MVGRILVFLYAASLLQVFDVGLCKQQYALNVPRVLLPLAASGIRSNFTVTATQGCFTWYAPLSSLFVVVELSVPTRCASSGILRSVLYDLLRSYCQIRV